MRVRRTFAVVALAVVAGGCAATRPRAVDAGGRCAPSASRAVLARSADLTVHNRRALDRFAAARSCACCGDASRAAALEEAKRLVARAKVAPAAERARLERRAGELLRELQGY